MSSRFKTDGLPGQAGNGDLDRRALRTFSGKVDTGFPSENATTHEEVERFLTPSNREAL
jgi:hypothetical protein